MLENSNVQLYSNARLFYFFPFSYLLFSSHQKTSSFKLKFLLRAVARVAGSHMCSGRSKGKKEKSESKRRVRIMLGLCVCWCCCAAFLLPSAFKLPLSPWSQFDPRLPACAPAPYLFVNIRPLALVLSLQNELNGTSTALIFSLPTYFYSFFYSLNERSLTSPFSYLYKETSSFFRTKIHHRPKILYRRYHR